MKYAEKKEINRKLQNGYIKEAVGKVLDMIKAGDRDDADASELSDRLYFFRKAVEFEIEKKEDDSAYSIRTYLQFRFLSRTQLQY